MSKKGIRDYFSSSRKKKNVVREPNETSTTLKISSSTATVEQLKSTPQKITIGNQSDHNEEDNRPISRGAPSSISGTSQNTQKKRQKVECIEIDEEQEKQLPITFIEFLEHTNVLDIADVIARDAQKHKSTPYTKDMVYTKKLARRLYVLFYTKSRYRKRRPLKDIKLDPNCPADVKERIMIVPKQYHTEHKRNSGVKSNLELTQEGERKAPNDLTSMNKSQTPKNLADQNLASVSISSGYFHLETLTPPAPPPSFNVFKQFVVMDEEFENHLTSLCAGDVSKIEAYRNEPNVRDEFEISFYKQFYSKADNRRRLNWKLRPCPLTIKQQILTQVPLEAKNESAQLNHEEASNENPVQEEARSNLTPCPLSERQQITQIPLGAKNDSAKQNHEEASNENPVQEEDQCKLRPCRLSKGQQILTQTPLEATNESAKLNLEEASNENSVQEEDLCKLRPCPLEARNESLELNREEASNKNHVQEEVECESVINSSVSSRGLMTDEAVNNKSCNLKYPVSFETFKARTYHKQITEEIFRNTTNNVKALEEFKRNEALQNTLFRKYYEAFYETPEIRSLFAIKIKPGPSQIKELILQIPSEIKDSDVISINTELERNSKTSRKKRHSNVLEKTSPQTKRRKTLKSVDVSATTSKRKLLSPAPTSSKINPPEKSKNHSKNNQSERVLLVNESLTARNETRSQSRQNNENSENNQNERVLLLGDPPTSSNNTSRKPSNPLTQNNDNCKNKEGGISLFKPSPNNKSPPQTSQNNDISKSNQEKRVSVIFHTSTNKNLSQPHQNNDTSKSIQKEGVSIISDHVECSNDTSPCEIKEYSKIKPNEIILNITDPSTFNTTTLTHLSIIEENMKDNQENIHVFYSDKFLEQYIRKKTTCDMSEHQVKLILKRLNEEVFDKIRERSRMNLAGGVADGDKREEAIRSEEKSVGSTNDLNDVLSTDEAPSVNGNMKEGHSNIVSVEKYNNSRESGNEEAVKATDKILTAENASLKYKNAEESHAYPKLIISSEEPLAKPSSSGRLLTSDAPSLDNREEQSTTKSTKEVMPTRSAPKMLETKAGNDRTSKSGSKQQDVFRIERCTTMAYVARRSRGLKQKIVCTILDMSIDEFKKYTHIYGKNIYGDIEILQRCYDAAIVRQIWYPKLYMYCRDIFEYLRTKGIVLDNLSLEYISPKLVYYEELASITNFDEIVTFDYHYETAKKLDRDRDPELLEERRMQFYNRCWKHEKWIWHTPTFTESWKIITTDYLDNNTNRSCLASPPSPPAKPIGTTTGTVVVPASKEMHLPLTPKPIQHDKPRSPHSTSHVRDEKSNSLSLQADLSNADLQTQEYLKHHHHLDVSKVSSSCIQNGASLVAPSTLRSLNRIEKEHEITQPNAKTPLPLSPNVFISSSGSTTSQPHRSQNPQATMRESDIPKLGESNQRTNESNRMLNQSIQETNETTDDTASAIDRTFEHADNEIVIVSSYSQTSGNGPVSAADPLEAETLCEQPVDEDLIDDSSNCDPLSVKSTISSRKVEVNQSQYVETRNCRKIVSAIVIEDTDSDDDGAVHSKSGAVICKKEPQFLNKLTFIQTDSSNSFEVSPVDSPPPILIDTDCDAPGCAPETATDLMDLLMNPTGKATAPTLSYSGLSVSSQNDVNASRFCEAQRLPSSLEESQKEQEITAPNPSQEPRISTNNSISSKWNKTSRKPEEQLSEAIQGGLSSGEHKNDDAKQTCSSARTRARGKSEINSIATDKRRKLVFKPNGQVAIKDSHLVPQLTHKYQPLPLVTVSKKKTNSSTNPPATMDPDSAAPDKNNDSGNRLASTQASAVSDTAKSVAKSFSASQHLATDCTFFENTQLLRELDELRTNNRNKQADAPSNATASASTSTRMQVNAQAAPSNLLSQETILYRHLYQFHYFAALNEQQVATYELPQLALGQQYMLAHIRMPSGQRVKVSGGDLLRLMFPTFSRNILADVFYVLNDLKEYHYSSASRRSTEVPADLRERALNLLFQSAPIFCHCGIKFDSGLPDYGTCVPVSSVHNESVNRKPFLPLTAAIKPSLLEKMSRLKSQLAPQ